MLRLGLQIPNFTYPGVSTAELFERVATVAVTAERLLMLGSVFPDTRLQLAPEQQALVAKHTAGLRLVIWEFPERYLLLPSESQQLEQLRSNAAPAGPSA